MKQLEICPDEPIMIWYICPYRDVDGYESLQNMLDWSADFERVGRAIIMDPCYDEPDFLLEHIAGDAVITQNYPDRLVSPRQLSEIQEEVEIDFSLAYHFLGGNNLPRGMATFSKLLHSAYAGLEDRFQDFSIAKGNIIGISNFMNNNVPGEHFMWDYNQKGPVIVPQDRILIPTYH